MKTNYDEEQISKAITSGLIPARGYFNISVDLVTKVAELQITDWANFKKLKKSKRNSLMRLYFKTAALNLLKYRRTFSSSGKEGFVYLMQDSRHPESVKIGKSIEPNRRLVEANCFSDSSSFSLLGSFFFEDALFVESSLHKRLNAHKLSGEWFSLTVEEVKQICMELTNTALMAKLDKARSF